MIDRTVGVAALVAMVVAGTIFAMPGETHAAAPLIAVPDRHDLVYDARRNLLYMTTEDGDLQRYDVRSQRLLPPFPVGSRLGGADITPDGSYLYATEYSNTGSQGIVHKVDLDTGAVTDIACGLKSGEWGTYDLAVAPNSKAFFTTNFFGSGWLYLREIDLTTDTVTSRPVPVLGGKGYIGQSVRIFRGPDRSRLLMIPPNMKWSKPFVYDAYADSFPALRYIDHYQSGSMGAVSRDGSLVAMELGSQSSDVEVCDGALHPLHTLHNITGGLTFDPVCDVLYVADTDRNAVVALDTNTWDELFAVDVGEDVTDSSPLGNGVMATDEAGTRLFISTASGVRMLAIPEPATLVLLGMATVALLAWARRLRRPAA